MANVTTGKNFPTPYDLRMEGLRNTPGISPASAKPTANIGKVGGIFRSLGGIGKELAIRAATGGYLGTNELNMLRGAAGKGVSYLGRATANAAPSFGGGGAATAIGIPALVGAVGGPILDMVFPRAVNAGEEAELQKLRGGPRNYGRDYKNKELAAGQAAENFRTGAGFPGQSPAAERAYQQQLSSTAQQVAQDPQLDAWSKQRALDVASKDYSKSEDMGMRIWAQKYGPGSKNDLASKVKPGQAGYDVIQQVLHGTSQQPAAQPNYTNAFSAMPDLRAYSNSMPNAIVRAPGDMPTFAIDDPRFGDYNSTTNQAYNLVNSLASRTTEGTLSLPWGEINRIGGSSEAGGIYPGAPLKLPVPPTQFGSPGYPALTADNLLPTVDVSRAFTANGMDPKFRALANAMYKNN